MKYNKNKKSLSLEKGYFCKINNCKTPLALQEMRFLLFQTSQDES